MGRIKSVLLLLSCGICEAMIGFSAFKSGYSRRLAHPEAFVSKSSSESEISDISDDPEVLAEDEEIEELESRLWILRKKQSARKVTGAWKAVKGVGKKISRSFHEFLEKGQHRAEARAFARAEKDSERAAAVASGIVESENMSLISKVAKASDKVINYIDGLQAHPSLTLNRTLSQVSGKVHRLSEAIHKWQQKNPGEKATVGAINVLNGLMSKGSAIMDNVAAPFVRQISGQIEKFSENGYEKAFEERVEGDVSGLDPDVDKTMTELVTGQGYPVESHNVTTADGYELTVFRIPHGRLGPNSSPPTGYRPPHGRAQPVRPPVLLQHGIMDSSAAFVMNFANQSLGFILADAGYDVWIGNNRGNKYSLSHINLSTTSHTFWNFTWDQMAEYDLPTEIDYVLNSTGSGRVALVGHSEGNMQAFAAFSRSPRIAAKVSVLVAMAPVAYIRNAQVEILEVAGILGADKTIHGLGDGLFELTTTAVHTLTPRACLNMAVGCQTIMNALAGNSEHINKSRLHVYNSFFPGGTSTKNLVQVAHSTRVARFQMFDYGSAVGNMKHYGGYGPPVYNLSKITVPTALFSGTNDRLADPLDVARLASEMSPGVVFKAEEVPGYAHLDFIWAVDANQLLYPQILDAIATHLP